jgi:hypothetical protein
MTQPDRPLGPAPKTFDWRRPPAWLSLLLIPIAVSMAFFLTEKHGIVIGVLAGLVYGALGIVPLAMNRVSSWSKAHPLLDSLIFLPLLFFALAYLTPLSLILCLVITTAAGVPWLFLAAYTRRRRDERHR